MGKPAVKSRKRTAGFKSICITLAVMALFITGAPEAGAAGSLKREIKTVTSMQAIPYETTYIDLPNRYRGYTELVRPGVAGERRIEAQVLYVGGRATRVISMRASDVGMPIAQVMRRGTKVLRSNTEGGAAWKTSFIRPIKSGWLSADFYDYPHHNGIDIAAGYGTPVLAAAEGKVSLASWYGEYGRCVIIDHADGSQTLYAHNSSLEVRPGQTVRQGQQIAKVGSTGNSTGNHLHFEIRLGDTFLDPLVYIDK